MSDNIPPPKKPIRRRHDPTTTTTTTKLPTPPPDPGKDDFLAYLDSLQKTSRSTTAWIATEDAFDHLDRLYKLMEQMLELREQNAKLHRRVRDLEHLNNLEKMHRQLDVEGECPELDKDTAFAETILESILAETKSPKQKPSASSRLRQSISRRSRNRSGSVSVDKTHLDVEVKSDNRRASADTCVKKPAKVSKWTKVKAAFKWEKASPTVSDAKSQDSGIGGFAPSSMEESIRYLRVPSTIEDHGHSPVDSGAAEISTPGTLSTTSSTEDVHRHDQRSPCEDLKSSDDEHSQNYIPQKEEGHKAKCHKTPWAKMKDIIQTRNSFKKKHRLSAHSDDVQIDVEGCSDEDVFEEDDKSKVSQSSSPKTGKRRNSNDLPPEVVARYQQAIADESSDPKKVSKWTIVKKAFLPPHDLPQISTPQPEEDEIQKNYRQLQKKLSLEFQEKVQEWDRTKQNSPCTPNPTSPCGDDTKDPSFIRKMEEWHKIKSQPQKARPSIPLKSEEQLPPEFRKKLQEWEKIRKGSGKDYTPKKKLSEVPRWKSLSGPKCEQSSPVFEYPQISEDFRRKLEEWKQIKEEERKPGSKLSPRLSLKHVKKQPTDNKELQWYEKELGKIEKEKQRLERERQRFLEREESLAKLRSSVVGGLKKEVLIHTPSGFYRFEGISRKFTQKLYEWEKARGIGPESSTFALLNSSLIQTENNTNTSGNVARRDHHRTNHPTSLMRSKSADSIAISALNLTCPLMSHQPSSLSLNDVDELEQECLACSKGSSFISHSHDDSLPEEPEALIVEVEDIVEETAAPLHTYTQRIQQPVYQRQELKAMCEGETCAAPKVRRSESTRAQSNYNLIEEIFALLKNLIETELEIQKTQDAMSEQERKSNSDIIKLKMCDESQKSMTGRLGDKLLRLQEANVNVFSGITREDSDPGGKQHIVDTLDTVQDLSSEIFHLVEKLDLELANRNVYDIFKEAGARSLNPITETAKEIRNKMLELRRRLSYICAATVVMMADLTAPRCRHSKKSINDESTKERLYVKSETSNVPSQGAIKKRIRYRQKSTPKMLPDTDEEEDLTDQKRNTHKKLTRTRSEVSESSSPTNEVVVVVDESILHKVVVPTQSSIVNITTDGDGVQHDSPVTLFVKTTRKLFTPIVESGISDKYEPGPPPADTESDKDRITHLPPLPASPTPQRKITKDISPSIRLMLAKYNQKISESSPSKPRRGSGSVSPLPWRSPSAERRVKAQTEKYQQDLTRFGEVQKSASVGVLHKQPTSPPAVRRTADSNIILKSSSVSALVSANHKHLKVEVVESAKRHSPEIRLKKLQKAKEDFLNATPPPKQIGEEEAIQFPSRNRLSQISVDSESSYECGAGGGALIKSASAGMINIDAEVYRQIDPEVHGDGYVSLPRSTRRQQKQGFLGGKFASIASKFRKVKMRRGKDKDVAKMNTVSTLCRQSLVVDIQQQLSVEEAKEPEEEEEEVVVSPTPSSSWIRKPKLFKK